MRTTAEQTGSRRAELLQALGALVVNVSATEESLHDAIWLLSESENQAVHVLTARLSFRTLVEKFGAMCAELGTARVPLDEVRAFCGHLYTLNDRRNTIIHSAWNFRATADAPRRFKRTATPKAGFSLNVTDVTPSEIRDLAEQFRLAENKLWEIVP